MEDQMISRRPMHPAFTRQAFLYAAKRTALSSPLTVSPGPLPHHTMLQPGQQQRLPVSYAFPLLASALVPMSSMSATAATIGTLLLTMSTARTTCPSIASMSPLAITTPATTASVFASLQNQNKKLHLAQGREGVHSKHFDACGPSSRALARRTLGHRQGDHIENP